MLALFHVASFEMCILCLASCVIAEPDIVSVQSERHLTYKLHRHTPDQQMMIPDLCSNRYPRFATHERTRTPSLGASQRRQPSPDWAEIRHACPYAYGAWRDL
eukprot:2018510-Pleurochrysis_carterae.AAC.9